MAAGSPAAAAATAAVAAAVAVAAAFCCACLGCNSFGNLASLLGCLLGPVFDRNLAASWAL
eukprot:5887557-Lingulodinium_polyedra.AAC.1